MNVGAKLRSRGLLALLLLGAFGCQKDRCLSEPASFELALNVANADLARRANSVELRVRADDRGWRQVLPLGETLADQNTTLAVVLDPAPTASFTLRVEATLYDSMGRALASGEVESAASPDGCNQLALDLGAVPLDGGLNDLGFPGDGGDDAGADGGWDAGGDAGPDATIDAGPDATADAGPDGGFDAGPDGGLDAGPEDADPEDADPEDADPEDADFDGGLPDGAVDAGQAPTPFAYVPSNFDPTALSPGLELVINTAPCVVTFDSSGATPSFTNACGLVDLPAAEIVTSAGLDLVVIPVTRLEITNGSRLALIGARPVVLAVYGDAMIWGALDASANTSTPGPGGSATGLCNQGDGDSQQGAASATAGGGGGGFGTGGAPGGNNYSGAGQGLGGLTEPANALVPLRGGCSGGNGGAGSRGGRGGGGLQISAAGTLTTGIAGQILAGGGGGPAPSEHEGAGGGGSGGGIRVEADRLDLSGSIFANGGGGAGGGGTGDRGNSGRNGDRSNPTGGGGGPNNGGSGGRGTGPTPNPLDGSPPSSGFNAGAGGGGGGGGVIILRGINQCLRSGLAEPTPSPPSGC